METNGQTDEERAATALRALGAHPVGVPAGATVQHVIQPTNIAPDAPIAAAHQEVRDQAAIEPEQTKVYQPKFVEPKRGRSRLRIYIVLATLWIAGLPLAIIVNALANSNRFGDAINLGLIIIAYIIGLYGVFGWIPLALKYFKEHKESW